jgi:hypothetical protein
MHENEAAIAVIAMLVSFGLPVVLVAVILYYKHRRTLLMHQTITALAQQGLPVPPQLLERPRRGQYGLRGGLVLLFLGIALATFLAQVGGPWSIGLIPGLMGVALLISWRLERRDPD